MQIIGICLFANFENLQKGAKKSMFPTLTNGKIMKNEHLFKTHFSKLFLKWTNKCKKKANG